MKELDLLKKDWQRNKDSFATVSEKEIYNMIHRRSSSIVKWILIISILEVLLWTAINVCFNNDDYFTKMNHEEIITYLNIFSYFSYGVMLVFIYFFYKNYVKISTTVSTKQLMKDILKTRKTVQYYVYFNLSMIVLSLIVAFIIAFSYDPDTVALTSKLAEDSKALALAIVGIAMTFVVIIGAFWLFYRLLYGILLRKLYANFKELKKIDL